jgi:hypothetical protein
MDSCTRLNGFDRTEKDVDSVVERPLCHCQVRLLLRPAMTKSARILYAMRALPRIRLGIDWLSGTVLMPQTRNSIDSIALMDYSYKSDVGANHSPYISTQSYLPGLLRKRGTKLTFPCVKLSHGEFEPNVLDLLLQSLERADAALMIDITGAIASQAILDALLRRLSEGLKLWVVPPLLTNLEAHLANDADTYHLYRDFLDAIGIELTYIGLFSKQMDQYDHPRSFAIQRTKDPSSFRDSALFRGVDQIVFTQAQAMRLRGGAQALAAVNPRDFDVIDAQTDWAFEWSEPDFAVMALSHVGNVGGLVVTTSGLVFLDAFNGPLGHRFPGGESNGVLLNNLLDLLQPRHAAFRLPDDLDVHRLIQTVERNLLEVIQTVYGPEWPSCMSAGAREKAEGRSKSEGGKIPWPAYLDLSDHINTLRKDIDRFGPILTSCGFPTSRNKLERQVLQTGKLMELRILDSHMTKRVITNHQFSDGDLAVLNAINQNVIRLWRCAKGIQHSS